MDIATTFAAQTQNMSDPIKHECGIALLRLKKDLQYYVDKYGTAFYGLNKLHLLMEKQHNRGQDGAGVANIKLNVAPGNRYISRHRSIHNRPIQDIFGRIGERIKAIEEKDPELLKDVKYLQENMGFTGELFLGHLRYGTFGKNQIESCHPFLRQNNWRTRSLVVAGNFNMTNVDELFDVLVRLGQHPKEKSDTVTVLEKIGHFIDEENQSMFNDMKPLGYSNEQVYEHIAERLDIGNALRRAASDWDGGYAMCGLIGHGDAFVLRDPNGIRPAFWYEDDEVVVVASERPVIQTVMNVPYETIHELDPGHAMIIKRSGEVKFEQVREPGTPKKCTFERIYFSRGNDADIYKERQALGRHVIPQILEAIDHDVDNTVFTFIPNTAETSFYGMIKGLEDHVNHQKIQTLLEHSDKKLDENELRSIIEQRTRIEKMVIKDAKLRTFISQDEGREDMVASTYDITYGAVVPGKDSLVVIDDSIVRGTTLKQSILRILDRLGPKKIVIVSSAPQIRFPDCYGIDMAKQGDFIAFQAAVSLLKKRNMEHVLHDVYTKCKESADLPKEQITNWVKEIYAPFSDEEIAAEVALLLTPEDLNAEVEIIFQSVGNLHKACPEHTGDWYFTGDFPTPGGNRVAVRSFINYMEGRDERAY